MKALRKLGKVFVYLLCLTVIVLIWREAQRRISLELSRDNVKAQQAYQEAIVFKKQGRLEEAGNALLRAIEYSEQITPEYYRALGKHFSLTHNYEEALQWYDKAIEADPKLEQHLLLPVAWLHAQKGDSPGAIKILERLEAEFPNRFNKGEQELLEVLRNTSQGSTDQARRTILFRFRPPANWPEGRKVILSGNWDDQGAQSDAYAYKPIEMTAKPGEDYTAQVELLRHANLPYRAVVTSTMGTSLGVSKFKIPMTGAGTQLVTLSSGDELADKILTKRSELQRPNPKGDGHKRTFIIWPDCGSWWFLASLAQRGLAPNFADLRQRGTTGEMWSDPPLTSIAVQRITSFTEDPSWWDTLKIQLKGIQALDEFIDVDQGGEKTLSKYFAQRNISFVDLTFNEPYIQHSGDQSKQYGIDPYRHLAIRYEPMRSEIAPDSVMREYLDIDRVEGFAGQQGLARRWTLATQWDDTHDKFVRGLEIFKEPTGPDILLLRLPAYDVLSHSLFENKASHSTGNILLEVFYVYFDQLLGEIRNALDADDSLILISDHGVRTALQHDEISLFLAEGPNIQAGAITERFLLQLFPQLLTSLVIENRWPDNIKTSKP